MRPWGAARLATDRGRPVTLRHRDVLATRSTRAGRRIPLDQSERIFERFTRLNDPRTSGSAGAGLGLAITRDVIQRHGGTIGVDPEYDRGTRFRVTLPLVGSTSGTGS